MNLLRFILLAAVAIGAFLVLVDPRRPRLALRFGRWVLLAALAAGFLAPLAWLAAAAFKDGRGLLEHVFLPPPATWGESLGWANFRKLFAPQPTLQGEVAFWQYLLNSLFVASAATVLQLFFCSLGGYALAKYRFTGRRQLLLFMLGSMMLPAVLLLAPTYELMVRIRWIDTYAALLVPGAANAFGMFLFRQAMLDVPNSLIEAARVDGAGEFFIYRRIVMPLVRPVSAAFCLLVFVGQWNSFIGPQVFLLSGYKLTLPVVLSQYVTQYSEDYGILLAGTFLSVLPVAVLFLTLQREFIRGIAAGAVKG